MIGGGRGLWHQSDRRAQRCVPRPAPLALEAVGLDVGHCLENLEEDVAFLRFESEPFVVEHPAPFQENKQPADRARGEKHEGDKDLPTVKREHEGEDDKGQKRENDVQRGAHEKILHPPVIADALHNVASVRLSKNGSGRRNSLLRKSAIIATLTREPMCKKQPATDHVGSRLTECEHELRAEQEVDETEIEIADAAVHDGLGKERQDQLHQKTDSHAEQHLEEKSPMRAKVVEEERQPTVCRLLPASLGKFRS